MQDWLLEPQNSCSPPPTCSVSKDRGEVRSMYQLLDVGTSFRRYPKRVLLYLLYGLWDNFLWLFLQSSNSNSQVTSWHYARHILHHIQHLSSMVTDAWEGNPRLATPHVKGSILRRRRTRKNKLPSLTHSWSSPKWGEGINMQRLLLHKKLPNLW
jgi:hypothetical protein